MILFIVLFLIVLSVIAIFSFPNFSPIPYYPSHKKDIPLILKSLGVKNNQIIFDLGAGDGIVLYRAARLAFDKKLNTQFIAVELNPILYVLLLIKRFFHKNRKNITVVFGDMFKLSYQKLLPRYKKEVTFYVYISPWLLERMVNILQKEVKNFSIISYMYQIPHRKHVTKLTGKHAIFRYKY